MNKLSIASALLLAGGASILAQEEMMQPIPPQMQNLKWMVGRWSGPITYYFDGKESKGSGTFSARMALNGRYVESNHTYSMPGSPVKMFGKHLVSYDPGKKGWYAYWFDSAGAGGLELWGTWQNGNLSMTSKPFEMPGMPEPLVMRTTFTRVDMRTIKFFLEMKQGDTFVPMMRGTYKKQ